MPDPTGAWPWLALPCGVSASIINGLILAFRAKQLNLSGGYLNTRISPLSPRERHTSFTHCILTLPPSVLASWPVILVYAMKIAFFTSTLAQHITPQFEFGFLSAPASWQFKAAAITIKAVTPARLS